MGMQLCPSCGEENPDKFRLCGYCGTPLVAAPAEPAAPPAEETRRTVSIVFSDLQGSTDLGERLDSEALREVLGVYFDRMRAVLERHGGTVEKYIGDAIMAVFGLPAIHEDDALRAVRAAFEMCDELHRLNDELDRGWGVRLTNRTGVNTGEVVASDGNSDQRLVTGDPVNVAARLEQAAPPVDVLIGETTYRLVADSVDVEQLEPLTLKGKSEPVPAYRLLGVDAHHVPPGRPQVPMLGRDEEMRVLGRALDEAKAGNGAHLVTVVASAGTGKSRLLREFAVARAGRAVTWTGRCPSYGDGITFWPVAEIVRTAVGIDADDTRTSALAKLAHLVPDPATADALAAVVGLGENDPQVEQIFAAVAALMSAAAAASPVVAVIEDVHWAQQTLLDLIDYLTTALSAAPVLVICTARPEFFDANAEWLVDRERVQRMQLEPLAPSFGTALVRAMLGDGPLLDDVVEHVLSAAGGNPLFIEQMIAMLIDDGFLRRDTLGRWRPRGRVDELAVPSSVSALLSARLERLPAAERSVLQRASVMGQVFYEQAIAETAPEALRVHVHPSVVGLVEKGLAQPETSYLADQDAFRFHHALIRDVAYHQMLKRTRADLHESFAGWLEAAAGTRTLEYEEIVGYHLEQSFLTRCELGPTDDAMREVGRRGGDRLAASGRRALARSLVPAAANLLGRAIALLERIDGDRRQLLVERADALLQLGEFAAAGEVLDVADALAEQQGDLRLRAESTIERTRIRWGTESDGASAKLLEPLQAAIADLEEKNDGRYLAKAWRLVGLIHMSSGHYSAAEEALTIAIAHADVAEDQRAQVQARSTLVQSLVDGPTPVPDALAACLDLQQRAPEDRWTQALVCDQLARLHAMCGDFAAARQEYARTDALFAALGARISRALVTDCAGEVELLAGRPDVAEQMLRPGYDVLVALDSRNFLSTVAARLAEAAADQGRFAEADELSRVSEDATADDDILSNIMWRCVRARCRVDSDPEQALSLVEAAVELARSVESPSFLATALLEQARIRHLIGDHERAEGAAAEAAAVFAAKGCTVGVDRAEQFRKAPPVVDLRTIQLPAQRQAPVSDVETAVSPA